MFDRIARTISRMIALPVASLSVSSITCSGPLPYTVRRQERKSSTVAFPADSGIPVLCCTDPEGHQRNDDAGASDEHEDEEHEEHVPSKAGSDPLAETRFPFSAAPRSAMRSLSLIHISEPTRLGMISYAVFC